MRELTPGSDADNIDRALPQRLQVLPDANKCEQVGIGQLHHNVDITLVSDIVTDSGAEKARLPKRELMREALHGILDVITNQMAEGNAVTIAGFGRFEAKQHKKRRVEGPHRAHENLLHADLSLTF